MTVDSRRIYRRGHHPEHETMRQTVVGLLAYAGKLQDGVRGLQALAMASFHPNDIKAYLQARTRLDELQCGTLTALFEEREAHRT